MSGLTENGCNGHSSCVPYESLYESPLPHSDVIKPGINPFVHRLQFATLDKLRVRIRWAVLYSSRISSNRSLRRVGMTDYYIGPYWTTSNVLPCTLLPVIRIAKMQSVFRPIDSEAFVHCNRDIIAILSR